MTDPKDKQDTGSGFVPIRFRIAGWGMLVLGVISLAVYWLTYFFKDVPLPRTLFLFGMFALLTGFYLLYVVSRR